MSRGELQLGAFLALALLAVVAFGLATKATITGNVLFDTASACTFGESYCDQSGNAWSCTSAGWTSVACLYGCLEGVCCTTQGCSGLSCMPGEERSCVVATGGSAGCQDGRQTCGAGGVWGDCASQDATTAETCNGIDDDCDQLVDEGIVCADHRACLGAAGCQLLCEPDRQYCTNVQLTVCALQSDGIYNLTNTTCPYGCANTTACNPTAPFCTDSDNGKTLETKGTMYYLENGQPHSRTDTCTQQNTTIHEYYCDATIGKATDITCPQGYICKSGACVPLPSCTETDDGEERFVKGRMDYVENNQWKNRTDTCLSTTTLHEYYCDGTIGRSIDIACDECSTGACVNAAAIFCDETDAGREYATRGTITYHESGQNKSRADTCNDDGTLHEYYCDGKIGTAEDVACAAGATCTEGACLAESVQTLALQLPGTCPVDCVAYETNTTARTAVGCEQTTIVNTTTFHPACSNPLICTYEATITTRQETVADAPDGTICDGGICMTGVCKPACPYPAPGCQAQAPENAILQEMYACVSGECYSCAQDTIWDGNGCQDRGYTLIVEDIIATAGSTLAIQPSIADADGDTVDGVSYEVTGYRQSTSTTSFSLVTTTTDVGRHQLLFTARKPFGTGERTLAQRTIDVLLTCPDGHPCCEPGTAIFYPLGTSCTYDGQEGRCTEEGLCIPIGTSPEGSRFGNCDDRIDNDGDGVYDCVRQDGAYESECADACRDRFCEAEATWCAEEQGARCVDTSSDWKRCGSCENSCLEDQECQEGACVTIPGCIVVCSEDGDCGEDETCYAAGTCESYCEGIPQIILNATDQQTMISTIIAEKTFTVEKRVEGQEILFTITNLLGEPLTNFTMFVGIPPDYALSQNAIKGPFTVESVTPLTLRIFLAEVGGTETVRLLFNRMLDPTHIDDVLLSANHETLGATPLGTDALTISRTAETTESGTTIRLTVKSRERLGDVRVPLEIPKCLAQSMAELAFDQQNYEVIQDDPLMVWTFDSLAGSEEISFTVPKAVSADCEEQLKAFGLAGTRGRKVNPWFILAIIPALGVFLILLQRVREEKTEHLSREEFTAIARGQGQSEEEIERSWRDYKRRF